MNFQCGSTKSSSGKSGSLPFTRSRLASFLSILLLCTASLGCIVSTSGDNSGAAGFYNSLLSMTTTTNDAMAIEIEGINKNLAAASMKLAKLEQVGEPCLEWIALQKSLADKELWSPTIVDVTVDLGKLKNDQYQVVKLEFNVEPSSSRKYSNIITILDVSTGKQMPYDDILNELKAVADNLKQLAEQRLKAMELSYSTAFAVLDQYRTWKVGKVNNVTYTVSGPALGYSGAILAPGQWTYDTKSNTITANDAGSTTLERIIKGR